MYTSRAAPDVSVGRQCDPTSRFYRPDASVFWYRIKSGCRPLIERRIDDLIARWQRELPWANAEQLGFHHIRHTTAAMIATMYGPQHKKRYLRHADGSVTEGYGVCTFEELARAMSDLLDFEHPLVHGVDERRQETMRRLGMSDDDGHLVGHVTCVARVARWRCLTCRA